jgi:hypothetical protein
MGPSESSCQSSRVPKIAAGHPKFGVERELRASTWGFSALIATATATAICAHRHPSNTKTINLGQVGGRVSAGMSERASALNAHKQ